jgi:small subunit ribosomal protein S16
MSVVIRLSGTGKTHAISYRIVVAEKWSKRDGKNIEILGFYNPWQREGDRYKLDKERYDYWLSKGAKPSPAVEELVETSGNPKPKPKKERPKKETAAAPAPAADQAPATEEPAKEEAPAPAQQPAPDKEDQESKEEAKPSEPSEPSQPTEKEPETEEPVN